MAIPNEALQKLVQEIEAQAIASQQQIGLVKSQITAKQRDMRLSELTSNELGQVPPNTNVYEGVGKMFVTTPIGDVKKRLSDEQKGLKTDLTNLEKRLHYLETTFKNSRAQMEQIFRSGGRS
ncbi:hypothetical protein LOZ58_002848 [Ophidiomyces ophidiicola]|nr:hypothetical protein LOZ66_005187 [Ophidiomyces ophidiicola]KAI1962506.1 hypothetical protein LOZ58_002848 [Ophidiomyces ophidiicola]